MSALLTRQSHYPESLTNQSTIKEGNCTAKLIGSVGLHLNILFQAQDLIECFGVQL